MKDSEYHRLYSCEYQGMQLDVLEREGQRSLHSDRSIIHSRMKIDDPTFLLLAYQQMMMASLALFPEAPKKVLFLGLGGASQVSYLHKYYPHVKVDIIECSKEIIDISKKYFSLPESSNITIYNIDARHLERSVSSLYDIIFLDLCDSDGPIPFFQDLPYLRLLSKYLSPRGWVTANTWAESKYLEEELRVWKKAFPFVYSLESPNGGAVIYGGHQPIDMKRAAAIELPQNLASHLTKILSR